MLKSKLTLVSVACLICFGAACSPTTPENRPATASPTPESKKITSTSVVSAEPQTVELSGGNGGEAVIRLAIDTGYHVNANPPTYPYLKATELEIKPAEGISVGKITYPQAATTKAEFADKPLAVYEGSTQIKAELKAEKGAQPGTRSLNAVLRIQACDEHVCYPPGAIDLKIPVTVKQ